MALKKFPQNIRHFSWNSKFKESWTTQVQTSGSGKSKTMTNQLYPGWVITESVGFMSNEMADELMGFVALVKGAYEPFCGLIIQSATKKKFSSLWSLLDAIRQ